MGQTGIAQLRPTCCDARQRVFRIHAERFWLRFAALAALALRVNIPVAALTTFVSNPLTMGPMYYLAHRVGLALLGLEPRPFNFELSWTWMQEGFLNNWQPLMLGCFLLGSIAAGVGYLALDLVWRASIADYLAKRRARRREKDRRL